WRRRLLGRSWAHFLDWLRPGLGSGLAAPPSFFQEAVEVGDGAARPGTASLASGAAAQALLLALVLHALEDGAEDPHPDRDQRDDQNFPVHLHETPPRSPERATDWPPSPLRTGARGEMRGSTHVSIGTSPIVGFAADARNGVAHARVRL